MSAKLSCTLFAMCVVTLETALRLGVADPCGYGGNAQDLQCAGDEASLKPFEVEVLVDRKEPSNVYIILYHISIYLYIYI